MPDPRTYLDADGREMFVSGSPGRGFWIVSRRPGDPGHVQVAECPGRAWREEAQADLDAYAQAKSLRVATETEQARGEGNHVSRHVADQELLVNEINLDSNIRAVTDVTPELVASIKADGVYSAVIVRLADPGTSHVYDMLDGHRRAKAALLAGLETVPARVYDMAATEYRETQLVLAEQHKDIDCLDRAKAIKGLIDLGRTQQQVADLLGESQSWVSRQLALLKIPSTHELIRHGILSGSAAEELVKLKDRPEMLDGLVKGFEKAKEPLTVEQVHGKIVETVVQAGRPLDKAAHPDCGECDNKTKAYGADYCLDPACWTAKREAFRDSLRTAAVAGKKPVVAYAVAYDAFDSCTMDCLQLGTVLRHKEDIKPASACFAPESECYTARQAERQAREGEQRAASQKLRVAEDAARQAEAEAREQAETERLARVETYLAHRTASKQKTLSRPEARLLSLLTLSAWSGVDYAARVLGIADDIEEVGPALAALSTRELTTIAVAHVLLSDLNDSEVQAGLDLNAVRDEVVAQTETPEPDERGTLTYLLDAARLVNPPGPPDPDAQEEEPATPDPCDMKCDECKRKCLKAVDVVKAQEEEPATPDPSEDEDEAADTEDFLIEATEVAIAAEILSPDGTAIAPPAGTLLATFGAEAAEPIDLRFNPPKAAKGCKGDCKRCGLKACDIHPSHAIRSHPEFEEGGPADDEEPEAPEDEMAPLPLEKAAYGPNLAATVCPLSGQPRSAEDCLRCCSTNRNRVVSSRKMGCCREVTSGSAPFHCPGGLTECPPSLDGEEPEDEPAPPPITVCPIEKVTRTAEHCRACCRDNKPTDGCCKGVTDGLAPFSCDGVECPAPEVEEAPTDAPSPAAEAPAPAPEPAAPWTCPEYGEAVEADFCRECNAELRDGGKGCCRHAIAGVAPFRCPLCDLKANCQIATERGVA